jgi:hypothetical protein
VGLAADLPRILGRPWIRPLTKREFDVLAIRFPYYKPRWAYTSTACTIATDLIRRHRLRTALELGPHVRSVIVGADVIDREAQPELEAEGRVIIHDATTIPWPIPDKAYGLFVGLQVFEHLTNAQGTAFREVRRVARHAIISLPIDWQMEDPTDLHHGITHEVALSWFAPVAPTRVALGNPAPRKRLIYVFENLDSLS